MTAAPKAGWSMEASPVKRTTSTESQPRWRASLTVVGRKAIEIGCFRFTVFDPRPSVAECRARTFLFSFRHSLFLLSLPFTLASPAFCGGTPTSRERVRSADGGSGAIFSDCRRQRIPFTKIPAPSGQGGSAASVRNRYNSLSLRRSAFSATIRWSMQSWMSPSMKAERL